ncbi:hypothetical protein [Alkalimonas amylolytica]|uniref:Uncharacterized protein n=1 Tax=Alkalimonas amylolytica TaxID=152573 RepID=A0A1H4FV27_ALKAM|nr:hypothetical protein [Alkalimonas amylolytica]SEB00700.1 hypothetical protein SAMN04488051_11330 [Alkalimonas amylolytica]
MKKMHWLGLLVLSILLYGTIQLLRDDPLHPDTQAWLKQAEKPIMLENNVHIHLMGLSVQGLNYERGLAHYTQEAVYREWSRIKHSYPTVPELKPFTETLPSCDPHLDEACVARLLLKRPQIAAKLSEFTLLLDGLYQLSNLDNFTNIDARIATTDFEQLDQLYQLAFLDILYLIEDRQLEVAAQKLASLFQLQRTLMAGTNQLELQILPVIYAEAFFQPLLLKLAQADYSNWSVFENALAPLKPEELLMNTLWQHMFLDSASMLLPLSKHPNTNRLLYKPQMTLNRMAAFYQLKIIVDDTPHSELVAAIHEADHRIQTHNQKLRQSQEPHWLFLLRNYRNITGELLFQIMVPRFLNIQIPVLELDLRLQLLRAVIERPQDSLPNPHNYPNPYTGELPWLEDGMLCHKLNETICARIPTTNPH